MFLPRSRTQALPSKSRARVSLQLAVPWCSHHRSGVGGGFLLCSPPALQGLRGLAVTHSPPAAPRGGGRGPKPCQDGDPPPPAGLGGWSRRRWVLPAGGTAASAGAGSRASGRLAGRCGSPLAGPLSANNLGRAVRLRQPLPQI